MKYGFSKEEYADDARLQAKTWENSDILDRTWRQRLEMGLSALLQHEDPETEPAARTFAAQAAIDLRFDLDVLIQQLSEPMVGKVVRSPGKPLRIEPLSEGKRKTITERTVKKLESREHPHSDFLETTLDDVKDLLPKSEGES